jgi:hypothetical protein
MVVFLFFIPAVWQGQTNHSSIFSKSCVLAVKSKGRLRQFLLLGGGEGQDEGERFSNQSVFFP